MDLCLDSQRPFESVQFCGISLFIYFSSFWSVFFLFFETQIVRMAADPEQAASFEDQQTQELADYDEDDTFDQEQDETQQSNEAQNASNPKLREIASLCFF